MTVFDGKKYFIVKFGLKGLILMSKNQQLIEAKDLKFILYCGLISQNPDIDLNTIDNIIYHLDNQVADTIIENAIIHFLSSLEIEELYRKALGEIGITLQSFYELTPDEIDIIYEGYIRRKETEANLTMIAIKNTLSNSNELIRLIEDKGYDIGKLEEREEVFKQLGI